MKRLIEKQIEKLSLEDAKVEISNRVYEAALIIEQLEHAGKVFGNGHHAAQKIAKFAEEELEKRWRFSN